MKLNKEFIRETKVIMIDEAVQSLKNKKVLFILLIYALLLFIGIKKRVLISQASALILTNFFFFFGEIPFPLLLSFFVSIIALPLFSLLLAYDSISSEVYAKSIRNIAYMAGRTSIFLGKFFAIFFINILVNLAVSLFAIFYIFFKTGDLFLADGLILWLYLALFSFYFVSLTMLASTITNKPSKSLFLGFFLFLILFLFHFKKNLLWASPYHYYKNGFYILMHNFPKIWNSVLVMAGFSIFFVIISLIVFKRKDL